MKKIILLLLNIYYYFPINFLLRKNILLESNPDFSDSTKYVYDELIKRKINKKYRIIWFVKNPKEFSDINDKNVKFLKREGNIFYLIRFYYYNLVSKFIVDCNYYIKKYNKNQFRIYIQHGNAFKKVYEYTKGLGKTDYLLSTSHFFDEMLMDLYKLDKDQILNIGFPRNDALLKKVQKNKKEKIVIWMPTYRNHKSAKNEKLNTNLHFTYGVPCISNEKELKELNSILSNNKIKLIIKLHPAEDTSKIKGVELSNIELFSEKKYLKKHENIYDFLPYTDCLITDYSSIYFDYTITYNKIALVIPDLEDYTKSFDLCYDYKDVVEGTYIYNFNELCEFFKNYNKIKINKKRYDKVVTMFFDYKDGKSTKRVVNLLEEHMKGK